VTSCLLNENPLDLIKRQLRRNPSGPEGVIADARLDAGGSGPAADHGVGVCLKEGSSSQQPRATANSAEKRAFRVMPDAAAVEISLQVVFEVVVAGHLVPLAALLVQPDP
jgi:hypothetical protein